MVRASSSEPRIANAELRAVTRNPARAVRVLISSSAIPSQR